MSLMSRLKKGMTICKKSSRGECVSVCQLTEVKLIHPSAVSQDDQTLTTMNPEMRRSYGRNQFPGVRGQREERSRLLGSLGGGDQRGRMFTSPSLLGPTPGLEERAGSRCHSWTHVGRRPSGARGASGCVRVPSLGLFDILTEAGRGWKH